jgi:predicted nucleic acid-binding protein
MRVLIDTNVLLDILLRRTPWVADSQAVWIANHAGRIQGHIVATSVTDMFYVAHKAVGRELAIRGVLHCLAAFEVIPVDAAILHSAVAAPGSDFEDNVMASCADAAGLDGIVTRDLRGFVHSKIPPISPAELIQRLTPVVE